ncbi:transposase family protein [Aeromonas veronii]
MTLIEHLTLVEETRSEINRKHNLVDVMFLVISAIMSGAEGWNDIETLTIPSYERGVARLLRYDRHP